MEIKEEKLFEVLGRLFVELKLAMEWNAVLQSELEKLKEKEKENPNA